MNLKTACLPLPYTNLLRIAREGWGGNVLAVPIIFEILGLNL